MSAQKQIGRSKPQISPRPKKTSPRWEGFNDGVDRLYWVPDGEFRVFIDVYRFANKAQEAWPGQTHLAKLCNCSQGEISRRLKWLVEHELLEIVHRGHMGSRKATVYRVRPPQAWPEDPRGELHD